MPCFHPLSAWLTADGSVVFQERARGGGPVRSLFLSCGQCIGCRLERSRQWAVRVMHEASLHDENSFITLTYDDAHLPVAHFCERCEREIGAASLHYCDFQLFVKRLRKHFAPRKLRFFMCGEYGENLGRPHFHACVFGLGFSDRVRWKKCLAGWLYRSPTLEGLWTFGYSSIGEVSFESAAYVARYVCEKVNGEEAPGWYQRVDPQSGEIHALEPEFCHMSLKPGIGADWMRLFWPEVVQKGQVVSRGHEAKCPKYYDKLMKKLTAFEDVEYRRELQARLVAGEQSDERLAVREVVAKARLSLKKRGNI